MEDSLEPAVAMSLVTKWKSNECGELYIFEVCPEYIGSEQIDFCLRVFPGVGRKARFVRAAIRKKFLFAPAGFSGNLRKEAA